MYLNFGSSYLRYDAKGRKRKKRKVTGPTKYTPLNKFEKYVPELSYSQECAYKWRDIKSAEITSHNCEKKEIPAYTGTLVVGIAMMHKSNLIAVTCQEQVIEVTRMRRG